MNVVDSSGWIEFFSDGPHADAFQPPILDTEALVVPVVCIYEVFKRISQMFGEEAALRAVGVMAQGNEAVLDRQIAIAAAQLSLELRLAMADSLILATTHAYQATLWTQDEHFRGLPGVNYIEK